MFIAKNRNGPDGLVFPIFMDTSNVSIKVLARADRPVVAAGPKASDYGKALAEKYKEMRKAKARL